jgi:hypothetical protein
MKNILKAEIKSLGEQSGQKKIDKLLSDIRKLMDRNTVILETNGDMNEAILNNALIQRKTRRLTSLIG